MKATIKENVKIHMPISCKHFTIGKEYEVSKVIDNENLKDAYYITSDENVNMMMIEECLDFGTGKEVSYAEKRKQQPVFSGVLKYFPRAMKEVANCSFVGNEQHHPGTELHWDMSKSSDEQDALTRHLIDHTINPMDDDGVLHLAKVAWRALAGLERYLKDNECESKNNS